MTLGRISRIAMLVLGIAMTLLGAWWIARNQGYAGTDFMEKDMQWLWRGLALIAMGVVLAATGSRAGR